MVTLVSLINNFVASNLTFPASLVFVTIIWVDWNRKVLKTTQEWSLKSHLAMKCQILMLLGLFKELVKNINVLDVDAKTETTASSENSGLKSIENEQNKRKRSLSSQKTFVLGVSQWCKSLMMTVKVEFSISTVELKVKYLYNHLNAAANWFRTRANQLSTTTSISTLEPITDCKSETAVPRNIDDSCIGKTIRRSRYSTPWTLRSRGHLFPILKKARMRSRHL